MNHTHNQLDVLMIGGKALWPLDHGHGVHGYHMAMALSKLGVRIGIASLTRTPADAPDELQRLTLPWPTACSCDIECFMQSWQGIASRWRERLARFYNYGPADLAGIIPLMRRHRPKVVIGLGTHSPMWLRAAQPFAQYGTVWYAADELIYHHLSCLKRDAVRAIPERLRRLMRNGLFELLFCRGLSGAIGVSPTDTTLLKWVAGAREAITIRNGVDFERFQPDPCATVEPNSLIFWGRLDFDPNVDAICWFARHVWPLLKHRFSDAHWHILGGHADPRVQTLANIEGIHLVGFVDDIRPWARRAASVVLPMRCGGGIKNKLLEAAAMGLPIIASPRAVTGLEFDRSDPPFLVCRRPQQWFDTVTRLWTEPRLSAQLRQNTRAWVEHRHDWMQAARELRLWLESLPSRTTRVFNEDSGCPACSGVHASCKLLPQVA